MWERWDFLALGFQKAMAGVGFPIPPMPEPPAVPTEAPSVPGSEPTPGAGGPPPAPGM